MRPTSVSAAIGAVLTILALTACGPTGSNPTGSPSGSGSSTPTATSTPTPTADADEPEPGVAITCQTIVSPATISGFSSTGVSITDPAAFHTKLVNEGNPLAVFFDTGGVLCQTGAGAGAYEIYGYAPMSDGQWAAVKAGFLADGYVENVTDAGLTYDVPGDMEGLPRSCYYRPSAFAICGNDTARLIEISDALGLG
ncbi:hypothetical protein BH11ACT3_BH11ACT3_03620 [soil metagenome]